MKKNITYYLEDTSRLGEISTAELNSWIEEMPYSQPLRMLASMKEEIENVSSSDAPLKYGVYFAGDYEPLKVKTKKEILVEEVKEEPEVKKELAPPAAVPIEIIHEATDDSLEDTIQDDLLEVNPNVVLVNEINHGAADEVLEDTVIEEVLEIEGTVEVEDADEEEESIDIIVDKEPKIAESNIDQPHIEVPEEKNALISGNVNYEKFASEVDEKLSKKTKKPDLETLADSDPMIVPFIENIDIPTSILSISPEKKDLDLQVSVEKEITEAANLSDLVETPKKKKSKKKKSKSDKKKSKKKKDKSKKKDKDKDKKDEKGKKKKKKKSKKTKDAKNKAQKGKIKTKKALKIKKPSSKKVKYVVVNDIADTNFNLEDYDGVSNYTSWLLDQKEVNGNGNTVAKKIKVKKKKKKKKSKVLQVAADSVKKSEMVISEPLAKILAAQGHKKKAIKMYTQLGLIFPEKSSYFAAQIENLKK